MVTYRIAPLFESLLHSIRFLGCPDQSLQIDHNPHVHQLKYRCHLDNLMRNSAFYVCMPNLACFAFMPNKAYIDLMLYLA